MDLRIDSIHHLHRGGTRFLEIASVLLRFGLADQLERFEPRLVKRWLRHEDVGALAGLPLGERARLACEELGPTFVKIGQILSTRPDVVSPAVAEELAKLQTWVPADPIEDVRSAVEESLGGKLEEHFAFFSPVPLASASIGQVHVARLHDGQEVVVKVRHPGLEARVRTDFDVVMALADFFNEHDDRLRAFQLPVVAEEVRRTLLAELDFRSERRHMERFQRSFEGDPSVVIPGVHARLCSDRVLTMEFLHGYSIGDRAKLELDGQDRAQLARDGARIFLDMVFRDGVFHADPHPGNLLVLTDGRIGLLDFGMVAYLGDDLRDHLVDLLVAFVSRDSQSLARAVEELASVPVKADRARLRRDLAEFHAQVSGVPLEDLSTTATLNDFTGLLRRHQILLPAPVSMLVKVLVMLDGTSQSLDRSVSVLELVQPYCEELIRRRSGIRAAAGRAVRVTREWVRVTERVPALLDDLARRVERGQMQVDLVHSGLETTVNRLVSGILCAAMLLGGAILWALRAPPVIFGIPVVGVLASTLAFVHGLRLLFQLRSRR